MKLSPDSPNIQNNLGFTIIEMMITMLIISIIVSITIPNFNNILGTYQLNISAREMTSDIRNLQQAAVKIQTDSCSIRWHPEKDAYDIWNPVTNSYDTVKLPASVDLFKIEMASKDMVKLDMVSSPETGENYYQLFFNATGRPKDFSGYIQLIDKNTGNANYVIIDSLGQVRVGETPS